MLRILLFTTILLLVSCQGEKQQESPITNIPEQNDTTITDTEELQTESEDDQRRFWQQPEKVISMFGDLSDKVIVDIGAGIGYFSVLLLPKAKKIIATEIDPDLYDYLNLVKEQSKQRYPGKLDVRLASPIDTKIKDGEVDAILIVNTITYIPNRFSYFLDIKSKLRPGGQILIVDYKTKKFPDFLDQAPSYNERVLLHQIEDDLEKAGFTWLKSDDTSLEYQYMVLATLQ